MTADIKAGDLLVDNDPRMGDRSPLNVIEVLPNGVLAMDGTGRVRSYLRKNLHTDGKTRKSGFTVKQVTSHDR